MPGSCPTLREHDEMGYHLGVIDTGELARKDVSSPESEQAGHGTLLAPAHQGGQRGGEQAPASGSRGR